MDNRMVGRKRLGVGHLVKFLHVFLRERVVIVVDHGGDARVRGADVRPGDGQVNLGDHHIGLLLRLRERVPHATLRDLEVDDLAFADLA